MFYVICYFCLLDDYDVHLSQCSEHDTVFIRIIHYSVSVNLDSKLQDKIVT